jgi:hypothetical protein
MSTDLTEEQERTNTRKDRADFFENVWSITITAYIFHRNNAGVSRSCFF